MVLEPLEDLSDVMSYYYPILCTEPAQRSLFFQFWGCDLRSLCMQSCFRSPNDLLAVSYTPGKLPPQGLCTCCPLHLSHSSPTYLHSFAEVTVKLALDKLLNFPDCCLIPSFLFRHHYYYLLRHLSLPNLLHSFFLIIHLPNCQFHQVSKCCVFVVVPNIPCL